MNAFAVGLVIGVALGVTAAIWWASWQTAVDVFRKAAP